MARSKEYIINLAPISWERAGLNKKTFFDKQTQAKLAVGLYLNQIHGSDPQFVGPLQVEITFHMPIPKTISKRKKTMWHHTVPDIDNVCKFLFDAITKTGVIWRDDRLVSSLITRKVYDSHPRTHLIISELE